LHHFYNETWARRNFETTPNRSRISISIKAGDEDEEEHHKRSEWQHIAKERKKRGGVGTYKDELVAMIETKNIGDKCKEDNLAR
jgi:predicted RNA-binding protein with RPS1 domain